MVPFRPILITTVGKLDDEALDRKERRIPVEANAAFRAAFEATLKAGHSVLTVEDGKLMRLLPSGKRELVRWIGRRKGIERGGKVPIRWRTEFPD